MTEMEFNPITLPAGETEVAQACKPVWPENLDILGNTFIPVTVAALNRREPSWFDIRNPWPASASGNEPGLERKADRSLYRRGSWQFQSLAGLGTGDSPRIDLQRGRLSPEKSAIRH